MMMDDMEFSPTCSDFSCSPTPSFSTSHPPSPISCTTSSISASTSFTTFPAYTTPQPQHPSVVSPAANNAPTTPKNKFCESASRIEGREGGHKRQKSFRAQQIHSPRSSPSSTNSTSVSINSISISFGKVGTHTATPSPSQSSSSSLTGLNNGGLLAGTAKLIQSVPGQGAPHTNVRQMSPVLQATAAASIPAGGNVVKATTSLLMAQGGIPTLPIFGANIESRPRRSTTPPPPPPPPRPSSALPGSPSPVASTANKDMIVTVHMPHTARESSSSDMAIEPSISRLKTRKNSTSSKKSGSQTSREAVKKKKLKKSTPDQDEAALMASLIASGLMTGGGGGMFSSPTPESPVEEKDKGPQNNYIDSAYELPFTPPAPRPFVSFAPEGATKVISSWLKCMTKPHLTPAAIVKNTLGTTTLLEGPLSPRHSPLVVPRAASMIVVPGGSKSPTLVSNLSNSSSPNLSPMLLPQNPASVLNSELRQVISGHSAGYLLFLRHLQREYASESLLFWKAIEDFLPLAAKHLASELERLQQQNVSGSPNPAATTDPSVHGPGFGPVYLTLYEMFIKTGSKMEINISSHLRELLKKDAVQHQKIRAEQLGDSAASVPPPPPPGPSPRTSPIPFPMAVAPSPIPPLPSPTTVTSVIVSAPGSRSNSTEVPPPPPPPQSNSTSPESSTKTLAMLAPPSPGVALPAPLTPPPPIPPRPSKVGLNLNHIAIVKDEVAQLEGATLVQNPLCNSAPSAPVTAVPATSNRYSTLPVNWMQNQSTSRSHEHHPSVTEMIHLDEMKLDGPAVTARRGSVPCQSSSGAASPVMPPLHLPPRIALSLSTYTHLFDAQVEIEKLLTHDCLPRFKQTPLYERWKRIDALAAAGVKESNSGSTTSRISGRLSWLH